MLVARGWTNNDVTAGPTGDKDPPQDAYEYSARAEVSCSPAGDVRFSNMQFVSVDPPDGAKDENDVEYDASNPTLTWSNLAGTGGQGGTPGASSQAAKTGPRVMFYEEMGFGWVYPIDNADGTSNFIPGTETLKELHLEVRSYRDSAKIPGSKVNDYSETGNMGFLENARCHVTANDFNNPGGFWQSGFTWLPTGVLSPWAGNGAKDVCQQFDHGGDLYYCPKATTANGLSTANGQSGKFGNVNLAANACLEEGQNNIASGVGTSCATRCDFTSPGGVAVTGNQAGSRTVMEFTILTKRFQEYSQCGLRGRRRECVEQPRFVLRPVEGKRPLQARAHQKRPAVVPEGKPRQLLLHVWRRGSKPTVPKPKPPAGGGAGGDDCTRQPRRGVCARHGQGRRRRRALLD